MCEPMHFKKSVRGIFQVIDQSRWLLMVIYSWLFSFTSLTNIIEATPCFRSPCNEQQCPQPTPAFLSHLVPSPACVATAVAARRPFPPSCRNAGAQGWQTSLTSVVLPDSLTKVGKGAFEDCTSLTSAVLPDRLA